MVRVGTYPFPRTVAIEGAYAGCSPAKCKGPRRVLVVDNATCSLFEASGCRAPSSNQGR
jgi:hypothetical protein